MKKKEHAHAESEKRTSTKKIICKHSGLKAVIFRYFLLYCCNSNCPGILFRWTVFFPRRTRLYLIVVFLFFFKRRTRILIQTILVSGSEKNESERGVDFQPAVVQTLNRAFLNESVNGKDFFLIQEGSTDNHLEQKNSNTYNYTIAGEKGNMNHYTLTK